MKKSLSLFLITLLLHTSAYALTVTESFNSAARKDSDGGMVWNLSRGELHPPLVIIGWDDGGGAQDTSFDVGNGSDGAFIESRYALFDSDGVISGGVIVIDTDEFQNLQFTSFNLLNGYTIRPTGSRPLVIRVQSNVIIAGDIDCSGADGASGVANINTLRLGGSGRCGGGDGGSSVLPGFAPTADNKGASGGVGVTGGDGGPIRLASGGQGGGGGASFIKPNGGGADKPDPTDGDDSLGGVGGAVGNINRDDAFVIDIDGAGSGGGGGSAFDHAGDVPSHSSGAGGGGGGGNIRIYAVDDITVAATGSVSANGGSGGSVGGGLKGGGGGGGAGGSILMFAGSDIVLDGPVTAAAGSGGSTAGGDGGNGSWGRTWIVDNDGAAGGGVFEDPERELNVPGDARYETGVTYTVTSKAVDLGNTLPTLTAAPIAISNLGGSTLVYELAFSDSTSLASLAGFALSTTYVGAQLKRYSRFQIQIDNLDSVNPVRITGLSFVFDGVEQTEFDFVTGCGRVSGASGSGGAGMGNMSGLLFALPIMLLFCLRFRYANLIRTTNI
jgi:hypothetical protein